MWPAPRYCSWPAETEATCSAGPVPERLCLARAHIMARGQRQPAEQRTPGGHPLAPRLVVGLPAAEGLRTICPSATLPDGVAQRWLSLCRPWSFAWGGSCASWVSAYHADHAHHRTALKLASAHSRRSTRLPPRTPSLLPPALGPTSVAARSLRELVRAGAERCLVTGEALRRRCQRKPSHVSTSAARNRRQA